MADEARIAALRAALAVAPDDSLLIRMLADALESGGQWAASVEERSRLVRLPGASGADRLALARAYASAGNQGAALSVLEAMEARGEMTPDAWKLRSHLLGVPGADAEPVAPAPEAGDDAVPEIPEPVLAPSQPAVAPPPSDASPPPDAVPETPPQAPPLPQPVVAGPAAPGFTGKDELLEAPRVTFADVGGMADLKEQIRLKIVYPTAHPEIYAAYGQRAGGGLLLYGPPGCGKTHLARATAGELGAKFIAVGIADILDMWIGSSERNVRAVFETARMHAPAVIFFDEVDALAARRSDFSNAAGRTVINQFLSELDGVATSNEGILVLGATNAPWHLDPAFRRPGRFDETLFVPPPDPAARKEILTLQLRNRPVGRVDVDAVVAATEGYSGADIKGLVDRAAQGRLAEALRSGRVQPLETAHLLQAARELVPSTREWFSTVRNYVLYGNQSGLYDAVKPYLR